MNTKETSGLANHAKANRINWSASKRCTVGKRHIYINGFCACGKMSKREENRIRNETRAEIEAYERDTAGA